MRPHTHDSRCRLASLTTAGVQFGCQSPDEVTTSHQSRQCHRFFLLFGRFCFLVLLLLPEPRRCSANCRAAAAAASMGGRRGRPVHNHSWNTHFSQPSAASSAVCNVLQPSPLHHTQSRNTQQSGRHYRVIQVPAVSRSSDRTHVQVLTHVYYAPQTDRQTRQLHLLAASQTSTLPLTVHQTCRH